MTIIFRHTVYTTRADYMYTIYEYSKLSILGYLSHLAAGRGEMTAVGPPTAPCTAAWKAFRLELSMPSRNVLETRALRVFECWEGIGLAYPTTREDR